MMFRAHIQQR